MDGNRPNDQIRRDPLSGDWVVISERRAARPDEYAAPELARARSSPATCPFCPGHETRTPPEVARWPEPPAPWQVRVVPNLYPAVVRDVPPIVGPAGSGLYDTRPAAGAHEVLIESPRHARSIRDVSADEMLPVFDMYAARLRGLRAESRWSCALVFKNAGLEGGASLEHLHSQLIATAWLPPRIELEVATMRRHHAEHGCCLICAMVEQERQDGIRIVAETAGYLAFCPFASKAAMQLCVVPLDHADRFEDAAAASRHELARLCHRLLLRLDALRPGCAYNYLLHTAPFDTGAREPYHWRIDIVPRWTRWAGFEWGSGSYINPVAPESAAQRLRTVA